MKKQKIKIGTRGSKLALWQASYLAEKLREQNPDLVIEIVTIVTTGDKILDVPLAKIGGKGLFTSEIERAILAGEIDMAVHSLKDLPTELPSGLIIGALSKRGEVRDALVSRSGKTLAALPSGAKIGTSSLRRRAQLLAFRSDLCVSDLRGNIDTRLRKLANGDYDALILAAAGLIRLDRHSEITELLPPDIMLPAVGQGVLAVEARAGDTEILHLLQGINDRTAAITTAAERAFLQRLEGGCQVPVGVFAELVAGELNVTGIIASLDGAKVIRRSRRGDPECAIKVGTVLAEELLSSGGSDILAEIR